MSVRVEWAQVDALGVVVVDEVEDAFGQRLRPGWVALLLGADSVVAIESATVAQVICFPAALRRLIGTSLAARILLACNDFEAGVES